MAEVISVTSSLENYALITSETPYPNSKSHMFNMFNNITFDSLGTYEHYIYRENKTQYTIIMFT